MADANQFFGATGPLPASGAPPAAQLPSADQFFGPAAGALPPPQSGPANDTIWSQAYSWMQGQGAAEHAAGVRRLNAAGQGFQDAWGAKPLGLTADDESNLRKAGVFNDYVNGHESLMKGFNEAIIRPAASAIDLALRLPAALAGAAAGGERQTAEDLDKSANPVDRAAGYIHGAAGELLGGAAEGAFGGEIGGEPIGMGHGAPAEIAANDATAARSVGALGEGEAGYYDAEPLTPENAQARAQAATETGESPVPPQPPPADVHALARRIDPETFTEYDALAAESAIHRDTIARLGQEREASPEAVGAQTDIDTILGRVNGVESRLTNAAAGRLAEARARLDAATSLDTPEMTAARDRLISADLAMRDLAPDVSAAYRSAREIAPALPEETPAAVEGAEGAEKGEAPAGEALAVKEGQAGEQAGAEPGVPPVAPLAAGASAEGEAAVAPPNVVGEKLGEAPAQEAAPAAPAAEEGAPINPKAIGNPRAVQGTGETVTRGLSREVEASAVENELSSSFGELPEYQRLNMKEQAAKAVAFMDKDYDAAKAVAMGRRQPPADLHPASVMVAVEKRATAEGDVPTLQALANSPFATRVTTAAQTIRTLAERDKASPLTALKELQQAREAYVGKTVDIAKEKAQASAEIKAEMRAAASRPDAWESFVQSITCSQ